MSCLGANLHIVVASSALLKKVREDTVISFSLWEGESEQALETTIILMLITFILGMIVGVVLVRPSYISH